MAKELAKPKNGLPAIYTNKAGIPIGTENIGSDDILLPRLRIVQPTSLDSEEGLGKIRNSVTEDLYNRLVVIPLMVKRSRIYFPPDDTHSAPECRSLDGMVSIDGKSCKDCLKSNWGGEDGHQPPLCAEARDFPCLLEDGTLCALSLKRSGIVEAKKLETVIKFKNIPFFFIKVEVSTKKAESKKGVYYTMVLKVVNETTEEERKRALEICKFLQKRQVQVDYGEEKEGEE
jgi:hypothetical protein